MGEVFGVELIGKTVQTDILVLHLIWGADSGKNPTFQEKFVFTLVEGLRELHLAVWNSNILTLLHRQWKGLAP